MDGQHDGRRPEIASASALESARELRERSRVLVARVFEVRGHSQLLRERAESAKQSAAEVLRLSDELQRTVRDYAAVLRAIGESPEQAVVNAKAIAFEAAQTIDHPLRIRPLDRQGVVNDLVRWMIAAYFGAQTQPGSQFPTIP